MEESFKVLSKEDIQFIDKIVPKPAMNFLTGETSKIHDENTSQIQNGEMQSSIGEPFINYDIIYEVEDWQQQVHDRICPKTIEYVLSHLRGSLPEMPNIPIPEVPSVTNQLPFEHNATVIENKQTAAMKQKVEDIKGKITKLQGKFNQIKHMIEHCPGKWDEIVEKCDDSIEPECAKVHNNLILTCSKAQEGGKQVAAQCDKVAEETIKWASQYMKSLEIEGNKMKKQVEEVISSTLENKTLQKTKEKTEKAAKAAFEAAEELKVLGNFLQDYLKQQALNLIKSIVGI